MAIAVAVALLVYISIQHFMFLPVTMIRVVALRLARVGHSRRGGLKVGPVAPKIQLFSWHQRVETRPRSGQSGVQMVPNDGFQRPEAVLQPPTLPAIPSGCPQGSHGAPLPVHIGTYLHAFGGPNRVFACIWPNGA